MNDITQIGPGTWVELAYRLLDADGEVVATVAPERPWAGLVGFGELLPPVEVALAGLRAGASRRVELRARDAFGERDPSRVVDFAREEFPEDSAAGDHFELENDDGAIVVATVLEVLDDAVVLDLNHPLAGHDLVLECQVVSVRPATGAELELAEAQLLDAEREPGEPHEPLLPVERLLGGPRRR